MGYFMCVYIYTYMKQVRDIYHIPKSVPPMVESEFSWDELAVCIMMFLRLAVREWLKLCQHRTTDGNMIRVVIVQMTGLLWAGTLYLIHIDLCQMMAVARGIIPQFDSTL
jgi:hypothetical protein